MSLLLLAGFTLVPDDVVKAARVDGATGWQRLTKVIIPLMKPAILVALLFRTLDAFRIFDSVFVQTRGAQGTETLSILGYNTLITRLNLGLGSAVSVLIFLLRPPHRLPVREGLRRRPGPAARGALMAAPAEPAPGRLVPLGAGHRSSWCSTRWCRWPGSCRCR